MPGPSTDPVPVPIPVEYDLAFARATVLDLVFSPDGEAVLAATAGGPVVRIPVR